MRNCLVILLIFFTTGCNPQAKPDEGFIEVRGGKVWYKIVGADKKKTPLLIVHGGPAGSSYYLQSLEALATDRPVILYDQLGCGRSDRPNDPSLWTIARFAEEFGKIKTALDLDEFHLLGHSSGTSIVMEYMATSPLQVKSVVLVSPIISTQKYLDDGQQLKLQLPPSVRDTLLFNEKRGTIQSDTYQQAYLEYLKTHYSTIFPFPKDITDKPEYAGQQVYETMWGGNEFYCTGNLKNFDRTSILKEIEVPVLFTCGGYDFCTPATTKWFADQTPDGELVVFEKSAHLQMIEERTEFMQVVKQFLQKNSE
jgi:proline iminopeptidase